MANNEIKPDRFVDEEKVEKSNFKDADTALEFLQHNNETGEDIGLVDEKILIRKIDWNNEESRAMYKLADQRIASDVQYTPSR